MLYSVCFFPPPDFLHRAKELRKKFDDYSKDRPDYEVHCLLFRSYLYEELVRYAKDELEKIAKRHIAFDAFTDKTKKINGSNLVALTLSYSSELNKLHREIHNKFRPFIDNGANNKWNSKRQNKRKIIVSTDSDMDHYKDYFFPFISLCKTDSRINGHDTNYFEKRRIEVSNLSLMLRNEEGNWVKNKEYKLKFS